MPTFGPSSRTIRRWLKIMGNQVLHWLFFRQILALRVRRCQQRSRLVY